MRRPGQAVRAWRLALRYGLVLSLVVTGYLFALFSGYLFSLQPWQFGVFVLVTVGALAYLGDLRTRWERVVSGR